MSVSSLGVTFRPACRVAEDVFHMDREVIVLDVTVIALKCTLHDRERQFITGGSCPLAAGF
jgi:hypothetical protein